MGVINLHADSFADVGKVLDPEGVVAYAKQLVAQGAAFIDVGAEPTNPQVNPVKGIESQLALLQPVLPALCSELSVPISLDTSKPELMQKAVEMGVSLINDVRALREPGALEIVAELDVPVCLMHMEYPHGVPSQWQLDLSADGLVDHVAAFLEQRIEACLRGGINEKNLLIDPGFGAGNFGKTMQHNFALLAQLDRFQAFGLPILIGTSRKTFIGELLDQSHDQRLIGSVVSAMLAIQKGADIVRVHDVKETVDALTVLRATTQLERKYDN